MKSLHARLNEAIEQMQPSQRTKFYESRVKGSPVEVQLNCAEAILAGKVKKQSAPITKNNGAGDNYVEGNPFGRTVEEFREGSNNSPDAAKLEQFQERQFNSYVKSGMSMSEASALSGWKPFDPANRANLTEVEKLQQRQFNAYRKNGMSESEASALSGFKLLRPKGYEMLSEQQRKEFDLARAIGISEADAFKVARMGR